MSRSTQVNDNGVVRHIADNAALILTSRLAQTVGIPLGLFVIYQLSGSIDQMNRNLTDARDRLTRLETTVQIREAGIYHVSEADAAFKLVTQREDSMSVRIDDNAKAIGELRALIDPTNKRRPQ